MPERRNTPAAPLPEGFLYRPDFLSPDEESALLAEIRGIEFGEVRMHGVTANRRVVHLGWVYGYDSWRITPGPPFHGWLLPLRSRAAALIGAAAEDLGEALITEYPAGAGIGWHRDAPAFDKVVAVSLAAACRLRFQRGETRGREIAEVAVEPRSAYALTGAARTKWQHGIPAVKQLRYSITFRTLRRKRA